MLNDDGAPTLGLHRCEMRRARKDYQCAHCGKPIAAGTIYWRAFMIVDGQPESMKTHTPGVECIYWEWPSSDASSDASAPPRSGSS